MATPTADADAATKKYVDDNTGSGSSTWTTSGNNIYYNTGNVGIGTNGPGGLLEIKGDSVDFTTVNPTDNSYGQLHCVSNTKYSNASSDNHVSRLKIGIDHRLGFGTGFIQGIVNGIHTGVNLALCPRGGYVGINTTRPVAYLHVRYTSDRTTTNDTANNINTALGSLAGGKFYIIGSPQNGGTGGFASDNNNLALVNRKETIIYAQGGHIMASHDGAQDGGNGGRIIAWWGTLNASDERIKYDIEDINDSSALEKLRELKPKTYKYRDDRAIQSGGRGTVYGFIAQEVKSVFPQGVSILGEEHVPNIQEVGVYSSANKTITFTNFDTSGIPTSGVIKVVTAKNEFECLDINYISIIDSHTIEVETDISEHCGAYDEENNEFIAGNEIYVEGCQVPDFHLLKKESIFTLATAALQEVDRQLQAEKVKVATLQGTVASQQAIINDLLTRVSALENA